LERYELPDDPEELRALRDQEEPVILGLERKEDFKAILDDKVYVKEIEAYLEEWADSVCDLGNVRHLLKKEE
jgi:hypothetical protein